MINYTRELRKGNITKSEVADDFGTAVSTITLQVGTENNPKIPKPQTNLSYIAYFLVQELKKYGIDLKELAGLKETNITHRFREFLNDNSRNKS